MPSVGQKRFAAYDDFGLRQLQEEVLPAYCGAGQDTNRSVYSGYMIDDRNVQHPEQMLVVKVTGVDKYRKTGDKGALNLAPALMVAQVAPFIRPDSNLGRTALEQEDNKPDWGIFNNAAVRGSLHLSSSKAQYPPGMLFWYDSTGRLQAEYARADGQDTIEPDERLVDQSDRVRADLQRFSPDRPEVRSVVEFERAFVRKVATSLKRKFKHTPFALKGTNAFRGEVHRPLRSVASYYNQVIIDAFETGHFEDALVIAGHSMGQEESHIVAASMRYAQLRPTDEDTATRQELLDYWDDHTSEFAVRAVAPVAINMRDTVIQSMSIAAAKEKVEHAVVNGVQKYHRDDAVPASSGEYLRTAKQQQKLDDAIPLPAKSTLSVLMKIAIENAGGPTSAQVKRATQRAVRHMR